MHKNNSEYKGSLFSNVCIHICCKTINTSYLMRGLCASANQDLSCNDWIHI